MTRGYLQIYTGNGKGKTTAAIGQGIRAHGHGWSVYLLQLMKGPPFPEYGEVSALKDIEGFSVEQHPIKHLVDPEDITDEERRAIAEAVDSFESLVEKPEGIDMLIVDEICTACHFGLADTDNIEEILQSRPTELDVVLTGRYAADQLVSMADIVTEMRNKKHIYQNDADPRKGIEW